MKHTFKKSIAVILATLMLLTAAPLAGFVGIELPVLTVGRAAESEKLIDGGTTEDGLSWAVYDNGELVISGEGEMQDYFNEELDEPEEGYPESTDPFYRYVDPTPWVEYAHEITSVTVEDGIISLGRQVFSNLYMVQAVSLPESLVCIGTGAFSCMLSLEEIRLPASVKTIEDYAFGYCISLENIDIPDGVEFIGLAFYFCCALKELIIPGTADINLYNFCGDPGLYLYSLERLIFEEGATVFFDDQGSLEEAECRTVTEQINYDEPFYQMTFGSYSLSYLSVPSTFEINKYFVIQSVFLKELYNYSKSMFFGYDFAVTQSDIAKFSRFIFDESKQFNISYVLYKMGFFFAADFKIDDTYSEIVKIFNSEEAVDVDETLALLNEYFSSDFSSLYEFCIWAECCESVFGHIGTTDEDSVFGCCDAVLYCYEDSAQHRFLEGEKNFYAVHYLLDSGENCNNYQDETALSGNYTEKDDEENIVTAIQWEIDPTNRTLTLSGYGTIYPLSAFIQFSQLYDSIVFSPDSNFTRIDCYAFACTSIKEFTIPATIKELDYDVFAFCDELTTIRLESGFCSDNVDFSINIAPYCDSFTAYEVDENNPYYTAVDGLLYDKNCKTLLAIPSGLTHVNNIVETVETIYAWAIYGVNWQEITIPDSVIQMPVLAGDKLKTINIGKNVSSAYGFSVCAPRLKNLNIHPENQSIYYEDGVFYNYDKTVLLSYSSSNKSSEYVIAETVKHISPFAFSLNEYLRNIIIPANVESIDSFSIYSANAYWDLTPCSVTFLNPTTEIYDDIDTISEWMPIYGYVGSTAEAYALKYDRTFVELTECYHYGGMATCESKAICTLCGQEYGELGDHVESTFTQEESCTVNGYTITLCDLCGEQLAFEIIPAAHAWGEWIETKAATCTQEGEETRTCGRCGEVETQPKAMSDHDYSDEWIIDTDSTCSQEGIQSRHCNNCSATIDPKPVEKKEHTFGEWYVVTEPTMLADGKKERKCSFCLSTEEETIAKLLYKEYINDQTGIGVGVTKEAYDGSDITVEIEEVFDGSQFLTNNYGKFRTWNIKTYLNGEQAQPLVPVYIRIPLPADYNANRIFVYHVNSQTGVTENLKCEVIDGYVCFYTDSFSRFIIVDESSIIEAPDPDDPVVPDEPNVPDEPDDPADTCSHLCHKSGIFGIFWKILRFFWKLFKMNPVCECGAAHY